MTAIKMKTASECRAYAERCRALAKGMSDEHRRQILNMADIWESLAVESERREQRVHVEMTGRRGS